MRDRLEEFKQESAKFMSGRMKDDSSNVKLLYSKKQWSDVEEFLTRANQLQNDLRLLESYIGDVKRHHSQLLQMPSDQAHITGQLNQVLDTFRYLANSVRNEINKTNGEINQIKADQHARNIDDIDAIDLKIRRNQMNALAKRLQNVLQTFTEEQVKYRDRCKQNISNFLDISGHKMSSDDIDDAIESGKLYNFAQGLLITEREKQQLLDNAKSRHDDILRVEADVRELGHMFQDMALLVESQGELMNRIENNVMASVDFSDRTKTNLVKVVKASRSSRKVKFMLVGKLRTAKM